MTPLRLRQYLAASVTTLSYIAIYLLRKPIGVVKTDLETRLKLTKNQLGWMDTSFFLPYALVQIFFSNIGDKYGARRTVTGNLVVPALAMISFGFWDSPIIFCILLFISGGAQATLWPNCVRCISDWFPDDELATVFSINGCMIYAGGILGTSLAVYLQQIYSPDLRMIFFIPSLICLFMAVLSFISLKTPEEVRMMVVGKGDKKDNSEKDAATVLNFWQTWKIEMVKELSFTMFGIRVVRYCLYMWLPLYFHQMLHYEKATSGYLSNAFEVGCIAGTASLGYFINCCFPGRLCWGVCYSCLLGATSLLAFVVTSTYGLAANSISLFFAGAFNGGTDMIITGALVVETGKHANVQSAVCGIVSGMGSVGMILQGPAIALVVTNFGWSGSFYAMMALSVFAALAVGRAGIIYDRRNSTPTVSCDI